MDNSIQVGPPISKKILERIVVNSIVLLKTPKVFAKVQIVGRGMMTIDYDLIEILSGDYNALPHRSLNMYDAELILFELGNCENPRVDSHRTIKPGEVTKPIVKICVNNQEIRETDCFQYLGITKKGDHRFVLINSTEETMIDLSSTQVKEVFGVGCSLVTKSRHGRNV